MQKVIYTCNCGYGQKIKNERTRVVSTKEDARCIHCGYYCKLEWVPEEWTPEWGMQRVTWSRGEIKPLEKC